MRPGCAARCGVATSSSLYSRDLHALEQTVHEIEVGKPVEKHDLLLGVAGDVCLVDGAQESPSIGASRAEPPRAAPRSSGRCRACCTSHGRHRNPSGPSSRVGRHLQQIALGSCLPGLRLYWLSRVLDQCAERDKAEYDYRC